MASIIQVKQVASKMSSAFNASECSGRNFFFSYVHHFDSCTKDWKGSNGCQFCQYCLEHNILLLCFSPHTTHLLQPLDVCVTLEGKSRDGTYQEEIHTGS